MGGAMDLVTGAKHVIVATTHTTKKGQPKLVKKCSLPLTGAKVVSLVVTEYALFRFVDGKMVLEEIAPEITEKELREITEAEYITNPDLRIMKGCEVEQDSK
jgi:3-oxoacid CoA-transferase subunit B/acetate CoA/acetoacetate CoA-transferase beta subunit